MLPETDHGFFHEIEDRCGQDNALDHVEPEENDGVTDGRNPSWKSVEGRIDKPQYFRSQHLIGTDEFSNILGSYIGAFHHGGEVVHDLW